MYDHDALIDDFVSQGWDVKFCSETSRWLVSATHKGLGVCTQLSCDTFYEAAKKICRAMEEQEKEGSDFFS